MAPVCACGPSHPQRKIRIRLDIKRFWPIITDSNYRPTGRMGRTDARSLFLGRPVLGASLPAAPTVAAWCFPPVRRRSRMAVTGRLCPFAKAPRNGRYLRIPAGFGRVGVWRGCFRSSMSVAASFVWRCLRSSTIAPFPHPSHRTGRADCPHPGLGQDLTPSSTTRRAQAGSGVRARSARRGARVDSSRPLVA
jgi:hypothetical protein